MNQKEHCIFCKIAAKEIPSTVVYETSQVLGFKDLYPRAPVHVLFIPKYHVSGLQELSETTRSYVDGLIEGAGQVARDCNIWESGYRLVINSKKDGGQTVDHLHLHLLGGRQMTWPPG